MLDLNEIIDPMARLQRMQAQALQPPGQQPAKIQPLSEQEEQGLLPRIGGAALGGLGYVGSVLEKTFGGRAIRGLLGGRPRELLSVLPFSDTLGITDYADRVSGRDLLRDAGLADKEDTWGNFLGGLGLEVATDPGTYLTFGTGAATQAGKVAQKISRLPSTARGRLTGSLADILQAEPALQGAAEAAAGGAAKLQPLLNEPLGGLFGWKIPFVGEEAPMLTGQAGVAALDKAAAAGQALAGAHRYMQGLPYGLGHLYNVTPPGLAGNAIEYGGKAAGWLGRHLGALFDSSRMGATTAPGAEAAQDAFQRILPYMAEARERGLRYGQELAALGVKDASELRPVLEGLASHSNPQVNTIAQAMRQDLANARQVAERLGINLKEWADPLMDTMGYFPRQWAKPVRVSGGAGDPMAALRATDARLMTGRESILEGFKEGTEGINKMILDPAVHQGTPLERAAHILQNYLVDPASQQAQANQLVKWIGDLPAEYMQSALGQIPERLNFFGHHPVADYLSYFDRFARLRATGEATQNLLAKHALDIASGATPPQGALAAEQVLKKAGLVSQPVFAPGGGAAPQLQGAAGELLGRINALRAKRGAAPLADLSTTYIPADIAAEIGRYTRSFSNPEALNPLIRGFDWLTNLFKSHVTAPWPGFHVRNLTSGQVANLARGATDAPGLAGDAYRLLQGKPIEWAADLPIFAGRNLTPEQATGELARMMAAWGIGGHVPHVGRDIVGPAGQTVNLPHALDDVLSRIPGNTPKDLGTVLDILKGGREGTSWNPARALDVAGVNTTRDVFTPIVAGRELGDVVEGVNRGTEYLSLLKRGYSPEAAAREVLATHFDYTANATTPFEKTVMRRLMPFYSYARGNIPAVIGQLAAEPGGLYGQMARLALDARQQGGFLPAYMGEGLAVPIGGRTPEGMQRYLSRLDLPADQAFEMLKGGGIQNTLMGLLGQLNPILKAPLEYAADRQFYSGRELGDLFSMTGNPVIDQILFNSPAARLATTARQVTDPRKWDPYALPLNLLTGAKVTDVDMPKYETIAEREYVKKALQGLPAISKFETIAVKPELLGTLTPGERELVRLQRLLEHKARESSKERKLKIQ
jgi:hypothetical protein